MKIIGNHNNPPVVGGPNEHHYLVEWRCSISAKSPEQAMRHALELILEPRSNHRTFTARERYVEDVSSMPVDGPAVVADLVHASRAAAWVAQALTKLIDSDDTRVQVNGVHELRAVKVTGLAMTLTVQDGSDEDTREYIDLDYTGAEMQPDGVLYVRGRDGRDEHRVYAFSAVRLMPLPLDSVVPPTNP
jgi:hypothetical protein